jgi:hypothetical protein
MREPFVCFQESLIVRQKIEKRAYNRSHIAAKFILDVENGIALIGARATIFCGFHVGKTEKCVGLNGPNGESLASGMLLGVK